MSEWTPQGSEDQSGCPATSDPNAECNCPEVYQR